MGRQALREIGAVLDNRDAPDCSTAESHFDELQSKYSPRDGYKYDAHSLWVRAQERMAELFELVPALRERGRHLLDAGCGDGMLSVQLAAYGHLVTLVDMEDWRDRQALHLHFVESKLEKVEGVSSESQDMVTSYNTFEHVEGPAKCLAELLRIVKPGGHLYFHFGPLYCSPIGLHAHKTLNMPYPQFLFSKEFLDAKLRELGINDLGRDQSALQPLNRWRLCQFEELFNSCDAELLLLRHCPSKDYTSIVLEYPECFRGRGLTLPDLRVQALKVLLRKPGKS